MDTLIQICFYTAIFSGGTLFLLLILSLFGGLDVDLDFEAGDVDVDTGGLGIVKSVLAFLTFSAWMGYVLLNASVNPIVTLVASLATGIATVFILSWFFRFLLKMQSNVNWSYLDASGKPGKVYLKIPEDGTGLIQVKINGVMRELKAKSSDAKEIPTGSDILILEIDEEIAEVILHENK